MGFACSLAEAIAVTGAMPLDITPSATPDPMAIAGVCTDTRHLQPGQLFVALQGEKFDGHDFVVTALEKGAVAAVVRNDFGETDFGQHHRALLRVADTLTAYQNLGTWWRDRAQLPVVAVTGSAGKTTTKELIALLLGYCTQPGKAVCKSTANHNNEIGVPQTLLGIDPTIHDFLVVEMGMRGPGEIARLSQVARPTVGVITNIGTAHIGRLGSQTAIAQAKCELLAEMPPGGWAVLNAEDALLMETARSVWQDRWITYGISAGDVCGSLVGNSLTVGDRTWELPLPGRHNALNFLAALAVLQALGLDWQSVPDRLGLPDLPQGRAQVYQLADDVMLLDETYNASPEATIAALHLLSETPSERRWAVLGTMKELGERSAQLHTQVGETVSKLGIDRLLVLADGEADAIVEGAGRSSDSKCASFAAIVAILLAQVQPGDRLLFKASRSVGMERVVREFQQAWNARHDSAAN